MTDKERAVIEAARITLFKTTVAGVGPFCVELPDGEIITTRTEARQIAIGIALAALDADKPCGTCGGSRRITVHDFDGYSATTSGCPDCTGKEASND